MDTQIDAKTIVQCDSCKQPISIGKKKSKKTPEEKEELVETIEATLNMPNGETKDFQFCAEECLRTFLNERRKKATKASIDINLKGNKFNYSY